MGAVKINDVQLDVLESITHTQQAYCIMCIILQVRGLSPLKMISRQDSLVLFKQVICRFMVCNFPQTALRHKMDDGG
jgi:hypothetical protein